MAMLILSTVFLGFGRSYYLVGVFKAPLPNLLQGRLIPIVSQQLMIPIGRTALWHHFATQVLNVFTSLR